jgi:uncharacterized protein YndB with AHSA1/START domain
MNDTTLNADGRTRRTKTTFSLEYAVAIDIAAPASRIWSLLTNAGEFPRWNSTVKSIDGRIAEGERIQVKVPIAGDRVFKLAVRNVVPDQTMTWSDGMAPMFKGVRTFTLTPKANGTTEFRMIEVFKGIMLPMIAGQLPDFGPVFEQYAKDLKREAEKGN